MSNYHFLVQKLGPERCEYAERGSCCLHAHPRLSSSRSYPKRSPTIPVATQGTVPEQPIREREADSALPPVHLSVDGTLTTVEQGLGRQRSAAFGLLSQGDVGTPTVTLGFTVAPYAAPVFTPLVTLWQTVVQFTPVSGFVQLFEAGDTANPTLLATSAFVLSSHTSTITLYVFCVFLMVQVAVSSRARVMLLPVTGAGAVLDAAPEPKPCSQAARSPTACRCRP